MREGHHYLSLLFQFLFLTNIIQHFGKLGVGRCLILLHVSFLINFLGYCYYSYYVIIRLLYCFASHTFALFSLKHWREPPSWTICFSIPFLKSHPSTFFGDSMSGWVSVTFPVNIPEPVSNNGSAFPTRVLKTLSRLISHKGARFQTHLARIYPD